ncbi:MAG TPA: FliI/YscN family ATPase [Phycisphaerales bacterium]|nr:FliI/YscN family ATPase [Phycisphaerales bacterium]
MTALAAPMRTLAALQPMEVAGSVSTVRGLTLLVDDLALPVGALVRIDAGARGGAAARADGEALRGEIIGFDGPRTIVMLHAHATGIAPGAAVIGEQAANAIAVGKSLLGRVIDSLGRALDAGPRPIGTQLMPLLADPASAMRRRRITQPMPTGVRTIDAMLTLGKGQRVGVFSGSGIGKTTLLGAIARNTPADINVIGLVGERGREVREFIDGALGDEGLARSVVVVATGDQSPLLRVRAALAACAVAEWFRDAGADVMPMMDSITRFAQAQRQIGLSMGEQPAARGYTPSVLAMLPALLERAGTVEGAGSITGLYAVLVEGDDLNEPISDAARAVLDGHLVLSRRLAARGHYPAINVLDSISRVADDVGDTQHQSARRLLLRLLSAHAEAEELISIGAYVRGTNAATDAAIAMKDELDAFLQQARAVRAAWQPTCRRLNELAERASDLMAQGATVVRSEEPATPSARRATPQEARRSPWTSAPWAR